MKIPPPPKKIAQEGLPSKGFSKNFQEIFRVEIFSCEKQKGFVALSGLDLFYLNETKKIHTRFPLKFYNIFFSAQYETCLELRHLAC